MKLLAIDTSTEACSAAIYVDGAVCHREAVVQQQHAERILPMCEEVLAEAGVARTDLDALAFGRGPGSFTGVRIATGVIQGLGFALELPVVPISSLAALAQGAFRTHGAAAVLAGIDARMDEVYWGAFSVEDGLMRPQGEECVCAPGEVPIVAGVWFGAGTAWAVHGPALRSRHGAALHDADAQCFPLARDTALLAVDAYRRGAAVEAAHALPVYLRDRVVQRP